MYEKLRKIKAQLPYIPHTFRLIWDSSRPWTIAWAILLFLQGLLPVAVVYGSGALAENLKPFLDEGNWRRYPQFLWWAGVMIALSFSAQFLNSLLSWVRSVQAELVQDHISDLIHMKCVELDISFYDLPQYYDRLYQARYDAYDRPVALLENFGALFQNILTFIAMAAILARFGWWLPFVLFVGMAPVLYVVAFFTFREYNWVNQSTADRRHASYFDWMLTERESAAELRLFGLGDLFRRSYQDIRYRLRTGRARIARSQAMAELLAPLLALMSLGAVMFWMLRKLTLGESGLGELVILYQSFTQGQRLMQTLLGSVGQLFRNILFIENLFEFLNIKPRQPLLPVAKKIGNPLSAGISFENVTFQYPGTARPALSNFNLEIPAGKIVAIVGENGAGKSTLIKLICRFYDPDSGRVSIDGLDLRKMNPTDLWGSITVLFQQPVHYHESVFKNIAFGELDSNPSEEDVVIAARAAGAHDLITKLPDGYQTILGKWFGGSELSAGEWQRVALARAFLRKSPIIILDEPTSAMDSWAEVDWMTRFRSLAEGRNAILVTHRFTTAMQADIIYVMSEGSVVESGSHSELLTKKGKYAQSWNQQMYLADNAGENHDGL